MFVLPASLAGAGLALQRQSEGWFGWDRPGLSPLWWSFPCGGGILPLFPSPPFPPPLCRHLSEESNERQQPMGAGRRLSQFEMAGALHAVVWKFRATWQVRRCRRNVPLFWEVQPGKARCSLAGSRVSILVSVSERWGRLVSAVADPGWRQMNLILTFFVWWSFSASRRRPSLFQIFLDVTQNPQEWVHDTDPPRASVLGSPTSPPDP
ncbi:hypothetical protein F5144DRAFT_227551 [Chaetomium tenue]|uniref:Uncharacterized protein n=1 Tax=Chaetomium tenue TaxID=1854479 RepID=A0ACB7P6E5_9PEZI|nr:hypothetical protein F5144DRAFT_227551 [Chaetomium globosum]